MQKNAETTNILPRPPIVVVVGHVDHGKTALLDYIRKTNVVEKEAGGITQSTGGYEIEHEGKKITFIDTPGHEAFSRMRARGATIADLAILVVASDEGVKPQTIEAINILKESKLPFVVAITKIDKPNANIDKVKNELLSSGVLLEGYGGDISWQAISSKTGEGISELLNLLLLMGEVFGLTFNSKAPAEGFVLESLKDNRKGIVAYLILKNGELEKGQEIKTPSAQGHIKVLENFLGEKVEKLSPSSPAIILGFENLPGAGEKFRTGDFPLEKEKIMAKESKIVEVAEDSSDKKIKVILKADTAGSLEVLEQVTEHLVNGKEASLGDISDGDVKLALSSNSVIVGFGVKVNKAAENLAKIHDIKIFTSDIIYKLVESLEEYIKFIKGPEIVGELKVLKVFGEAEKNQIIGGVVESGIIKSGSEILVERGEGKLGSGKIINLQEKKEDIGEVGEGVECGLLIDSTIKIKVGDKIKAL